VFVMKNGTVIKKWGKRGSSPTVREDRFRIP